VFSWSLRWANHQQKSHQRLLCESLKQIRRPQIRRTEIAKKTPKITKKKKQRGQQIRDKEQRQIFHTLEE
jgi:hypothetical protein